MYAYVRYIHIHTDIHIHICIHIYIYVCMYVYTHIRIYVLQNNVCIYIYIFTYICIHPESVHERPCVFYCCFLLFFWPEGVVFKGQVCLTGANFVSEHAAAWKGHPGFCAVVSVVLQALP